MTASAFRALRTIRTLGLVATTLLALAAPSDAGAQKALVYCPVGVDVTGCDNTVAAIGSEFPDGVDRLYDGTSGTLDVRTAQLWDYAVLVVPSLADGSDKAPYALLRDAAVSERLHDAIMGRVAMWSGTPDQGTTNRDLKDALLRNLARWAQGNYATVKGPGLVVLQDLSDSTAGRYGWLKGISGLTIVADSAVNSYAAVRTLSSTATAILSSGGSQIAYANMASLGFYLPEGAAGVTLDAVGQTGTSTGGQVVLLTSSGGNSGKAVLRTDKDDYAPGDTVTITGTGFQPGETVNMVLHEDPEVHDNRTLTSVADASGGFVNRSFAPETHDIGVRFILTATGAASGVRAEATFTDANAVKLTAGAQTPNPVAPAANATFLVTVEGTGSTNTGTVTLSAVGLPSAVNATWSTNPVSVGKNTNQQSTLTLRPNGSVAAGSYPFTIRSTATAANAGAIDDLAATLVVGSACVAPSISAQPASATKTVGDAVSFSVTATGTPAPTYQWRKGGTNIAAATAATYSIASVVSTDAGSYDVVVSNGCGTPGSVTSNAATLTVNQATQTISFAPLPNKTFGDAPFTVSATASSGLAVTFALGAASTGCSISGSTVTITGATAGSAQCVIVASQAGNANYAAATPVSQGFSIAKRAATVTLTTPPYVYDGAAKAATSTTTPSGLSVGYAYSQTGNPVAAPTNAGTYDVTATIADANYSGSATGTLSIAQAPQSITFTSVAPSGATVGGTYAVSATGGASGNAVQFAAKIGVTACTVAGSTVTFAGAGSCTVVATQAGNANYAAATPAEQTFTVTKAAATLALTNLTGHTYNGSAQYATATTTPAGLTTVTITYAQGTTAVTAPTNAGSYTATASLDNAAYTATDATGTLVIDKATPTFTSLAAPTITYGASTVALSGKLAAGTLVPSGNVTVTLGTGGAAVSQTAALGADGTFSSNFSVATLSAAGGPYPIGYSHAGDGNFNGASDNSKTLTVLRATQSISFAALGGKTFGDAPFTVSATATSGLGVSFGAAGDCSVSGSTVTITGAGSCSITASQAGDGNYDPAPSVERTFAIARANQTIDFDALAPKTFGDAPFTVSATASSGLAVSFAASGKCSVLGTTVTITGAGSCTITASQAGSTNYNAAPSVPQTFAIAKKSTTITLATPGATYDGASHGATASTPDLGATGITITYNGSTTVPTAAGTYAVVASLDDDNYQADDATGSLVISPRAISVKANDAGPITYGQATPGFSYTLVTGSFVGADAAAFGATVHFQLDGAAVPAGLVGAGTHTVSLSWTYGSSNYNISAASPATGTLVVNKAPLQVNADAKLMTYGQSAPPLTWTYGGFVTGENAGNVTITGAASCSIAAAAGPNAGTYPNAITCAAGTLDAANYRFTTGTLGTLTIERAPGSVSISSTPTTPTYGGSYTPTFDKHGSDGAVTLVSLTTGTCTVASNVVSFIAAGTCDLRADMAQGTNYTAAQSTPPQSFTIAKAAPTVTVTWAGGTYTGSAFTASAAVTGVGSPAEVVGTPAPTFAYYAGATAAGSPLGGAPTNVGTYTVRASFAGNGNYTSKYADKTITITAAGTSLATSASPSTQQYSDLTTLTATVTSAAGTPTGGTVQFKIDGANVGSPVALSGNTATLANYAVVQGPGAHTVSAVFTSTDANFTGTSGGTQTLTVNKEDSRVTYTGMNFVSTPSVSTSSATVPLRTSIQDITAITTAGDANAGDITKATVSFVIINGTTSTPIGSCTNLPVTLIPGATSGGQPVGTASCSWTASIGSDDSQQFTIGTVVNGYYVADGNGEEETVITVSKPLSGFITGGGFLVNSASSGRYAGAAGAKSNFGFNVKNNKSGTNLQGNVNIIIRNGSRVYQIKSNAISSMTATLANGTSPGTAQFSGKANVQDITNPLAPVSVAGGGTIQMTLTDKGEPGSTDMIGFTVWNGSDLLFSSNWVGTKTVEQTLGGGNLQVR